MKRFFAILLALLIVFSLSGCMCIPSNNRHTNMMEIPKNFTPATTAPAMNSTEAPTEEPTMEPTEEPTEEPTMESTEEPTEEPTTAPTEKPTTEPTEKPTTEPVEEPTVNMNELSHYYHNYTGLWFTTSQNQYIEAWLEGGIYYLKYTNGSSDGNKMATALASIQLIHIQNYIAIFYYSDDGWGNSGTLTMDFSQPEKITCTVNVTNRQPFANWGLTSGTFEFFPDYLF